MNDPCIICVAITGSVPTKRDNPAVPISISEQIESTQECFEIGASIVHCHVRNDDGTPSIDPNKYQLLKEGIEKYCPGMIIQLSTGGRSGHGFDRGKMLPLKPDMASLTVGSNNFPTRVYENPPDLVDWLAEEMIRNSIKPEIEIFDLSHIHQAASLAGQNKLKGNLYVQFVMGVKNAMPADLNVFEYYISTVKRLLPKASWCGAGIGKHQKTLNEWCIKLGGHVRTGLEDNIRIDKNKLAPSNASLVKIAKEICEQYSRPVASWKKAREILELG